MPYYIQNPALQGFQEGNQTARQNMGIFGGMMENYLNNAAAFGRQMAQQTSALQTAAANLAAGFSPSGAPIPVNTNANAEAGKIAYDNILATLFGATAANEEVNPFRGTAYGVDPKTGLPSPNVSPIRFAMQNYFGGFSNPNSGIVKSTEEPKK